jgi:hypothetical protein
MYRVSWHDPDLLLAISGPALILLGASSLARRQLQGSNRRQGWWDQANESWDRSSRCRALLGPWTFAEELAMTVARFLFVVFGYLVLSRVLGGAPPSADLVDQTFHQTAEIVITVVQVAAAG